MNGIHIRKYHTKDRQELTNLWARVFPDNPSHSEPCKVIDAKLKVDDLIFVAEESLGLLAGACMAGYDGHRGWLYAVAVLPEFRREGYGQGLILHAIDELKALGCIKLNLQIRSSNHEVAKFYESLGFVIEDRISMGLHTA